jgi:hypothetical protein
VDDVCNRRLEDLHRLHRSDPVKTKENLAGRIKTLETKIDRTRDLFIDGDLPRPDYEAKKASIQEEIEVLRQEFSKVDDLDDEIRCVEALRETLLSMENPLSGHYVLTEGPEDWDELIDEDLSYGSEETAAMRRQNFYRRVGMRVKVGEELEILLGVDKISVCKVDTVSGYGSVESKAGRQESTQW